MGGVVDWPTIHQVHAATMRLTARNEPRAAPSFPQWHDPSPLHVKGASAVELILQRRSCVALDGKTSLEFSQFLQIMDAIMPRPQSPTLSPLLWPRPRIDLVIFVHRVEGLEPGTYFLHRTTADALVRYRLAFDAPGLEWEQPAPQQSPGLFKLKGGDLQVVTKHLACWQDIAADGAFSLGMFGDFCDWESGHCYKELLWESGMIGQLLYLAAEAQGVRGTGIGCFMDDGVHALMGLLPFDQITSGSQEFLKGLQDEPRPRHLPFNSLYHFTVGGPIEDDRLILTPPYAHLQRDGSRDS